MNRDARQTASLYYSTQGRYLDEDLAALSANQRAIIVWLPQLVALMKPVSHLSRAAWLDLEESPSRADAWYVHLLIGDLQLACTLGAGLEPLEYLCFQRGLRSSQIHVSSWARFISRGMVPHPLNT